MENTADRFKITALMVLCGTAGSMVIGFLLLQTRIFHQGSPGFQFIVFGFVLSLLIAMAMRHSRRSYLYSALFALALLPLTTTSLQKLKMHLLIRDLVTAISMAVPVFAVSNMEDLNTTRLKVFGPIAIWTPTIIASYGMAGMLLSIIYKPHNVLGYLAYQFRFGFLIGFGISSGISACLLLLSRFGAAGGMREKSGDNQNEEPVSR